MIPHLEKLLEMSRQGTMPMEEVVSHIIKSVAVQGERADFDGLPDELKGEVLKKIDWYKSSGGWFVVSNSGTEDFGGYADSFITKVEVVQ